MVLVIDKKFLQGTWWKYGLGLAGAQMISWFALGFASQPSFSIIDALTRGLVIWISWVFFAMLPFALGRLGLKRLYWCGLIGFVMGDTAYFILSGIDSVKQLNSLLPFIAFAQLNTALLSLGMIMELGRYVYRKVFEE